MSLESNEGGIRVVLRDQTGNVIATLSQKIYTGYFVEMVEALAAIKTLLFFPF
jgi:hypothetical protein